jgi:serine/threonine protein kinase
LIGLNFVRVEIFRDQKLEKPGFRLISNQIVCELLCFDESKFHQWHRGFRDTAILRDFNSNYSIITAIGKGTFATVYQAVRAADGREFAIKSFDKRKVSPEEKQKVYSMRIIPLPSCHVINIIIYNNS